MHKLRISATIVTLVYFCVNVVVGQMKHEGMGPYAVSQAIAVLHPTKGSSVSGVVKFSVVDNGVRVIADVTGLAPGKHGFHIHEYGDCSALDGSSAGGHFNPTGMPHSMPSSDKRHVGDLGNIVADSTGTAHMDYVDTMISFSGSNSVIGRGVIVHEKEDDLKTQPTGNAGARLACGVIGIAK
jgi:Cu-Zn family superoxide dismutase